MTSNETDSRASAEAQAHETIIACEKCGYEWVTRSEMERVTCPNCQHKTKQNLVEIRRTERAKWTCDGATSIEEMAERHEQKASYLRDLNNSGWELEDDTVRDYAHLTYDLTEMDEDGD